MNKVSFQKLLCTCIRRDPKLKEEKHRKQKVPLQDEGLLWGSSSDQAGQRYYCPMNTPVRNIGKHQNVTLYTQTHTEL